MHVLSKLRKPEIDSVEVDFGEPSYIAGAGLVDEKSGFIHLCKTGNLGPCPSQLFASTRIC
jgi:hypothetical protein